jgi:MMPL family
LERPKAILLNLLSVGAAYGVLVIVFQGSWAEGLLDFESSGAIVPWLPLFMFVILFGLSMDYHVFILTRVKEAYDGGMSTDKAVSHAIKGTAEVVTSAAVVMVGLCPYSCSTTATSPPSAPRPLRPGRGSRARCATTRRRRPASPAGTSCGGGSRPVTKTARWPWCPAMSRRAPGRSPCATSRSLEHEGPRLSEGPRCDRRG